MSTNLLPLLTQRMFNRPLLIHPMMADALYGVLDGRINVGAFGADIAPVKPEPEASQFKGTRTREDGSRRLTRAHGKTAILTIDGSLVNRGAWVGADMCTGLVSYEGIGAQIDDVAAEAGIENVILDLNSYGGEATGMAGLAAKVRNLAKTKYVIAVVNDVAASAGYGIAASADEIVVSPTSVVGSIGVVMLHLDRSAEMAAKGVRPTLIHAGAHKVDGHPFGPLPENVRADMQRDVMAFYDQFLGVVEAGRGKSRLSVKKARETEARTFIGQEAVDAGLADRVASLDEVLAKLSRPSRATSSSPKKGPKSMHQFDADASTITSIRTAERARIKSILGLPEAQGRQSSAVAFALDTDMSLDAAKAALGGIPLATSTIPAPGDRGTSAELGFGPGGDSTGHSADATRAGWKKAFAKVGGQ